ncbi:MAG: hypothetical protein ACLTK0_06015 [Anaerovoracaceae bacterium]
MDYFDYVRNLKSDPTARKVKLADMAHNSDETGFSEFQTAYRRQMSKSSG